MFDPQTAGGFLAAVPGEQALDILEALTDLGHDAAVVGRMEASEGVPLVLDG